MITKTKGRKTMETNETVMMNLIIYAGEARAFAIEALREVRNKNFELAKEKLTLSEEKAHEAHNFQTQLIVKETSGEGAPMSLLMVHAQDHVMTALTLRELVAELIPIFEEIN